MRVFALYNIKGGVGKTTSAVNLAWVSARAGFRTLLWDMDPQASSTFYLRIRPKVDGGGRRLILGDGDVDRHIRESDFPGLHVLPADFSYRKMDAALEGVDDAGLRLARLLEPLARDYEHVFLDCAPNVSRLGQNFFAASDVLLIPTIPTTLSLRTLARLMMHLKKRKERQFLVLPFFTMVDRRRTLHRKICQWVKEQELGFLDAEVPYSSQVEQMGVHRNPIFAYAPTSQPSVAYRRVWDELIVRVEGTPERSPLFSRSARGRLEEIGRSAPWAGGRRPRWNDVQGLGDGT